MITFLVAAVVFVVGFILGVLTDDSPTERDYQREAIKRGFARYNETTGEWEWKEKDNA